MNRLRTPAMVRVKRRRNGARPLRAPWQRLHPWNGTLYRLTIASAIALAMMMTASATCHAVGNPLVGARIWDEQRPSVTEPCRIVPHLDDRAEAFELPESILAATKLLPDEFRRYAAIVAVEAMRYPPRHLQYVDAVCLLRFSDDRIVGYYNHRCVFLNCREPFSGRDVCETFHHELMGLIYSQSGQFPSVEWQAALPADFSYCRCEPQNERRQLDSFCEARGWIGDRLLDAGFVDQYALTCEENDVCEMSCAAMMYPQILAGAGARSPQLRRKHKIWLQFMKKLEPSFEPPTGTAIAPWEHRRKVPNLMGQESYPGR